MSEQDDDPFAGISEVIPQTKSKRGSKKPNPNKAMKQLIEPIAKPKDKPKNKPKPKEKGKVDDRAKMIMSIQSYCSNSRLGPYLLSKKVKCDDHHLNTLSVNDLQIQLEKIELLLSGKNNNGMMSIILSKGMRFGEQMVCQKTNFDVHGLCEQLEEDEVYLDMVERLKLKYSSPIKMPLEFEFALHITQACIMIHGQNKFKGSLSSDIDLDKEIVI